MARAGWEPTTEAEVALYEALLAGDQERYFRVLARVQVLLPVSADAAAGRAPMGWATWTSNDHTHLLAFTSPASMRTCLAEHAGAARRMTLAELSSVWPNHEWWLAINPGLPIEGYLPAWFVAQLSQGDARLPGQGGGSSSPAGPRDRLARVEAMERAKAARAAGNQLPPRDHREPVRVTATIGQQRALPSSPPAPPAEPCPPQSPWVAPGTPWREPAAPANSPRHSSPAPDLWRDSVPPPPTDFWRDSTPPATPPGGFWRDSTPPDGRADQGAPWRDPALADGRADQSGQRAADFARRSGPTQTPAAEPISAPWRDNARPQAEPVAAPWMQPGGWQQPGARPDAQGVPGPADPAARRDQAPPAQWRGPAADPAAQQLPRRQPAPPPPAFPWEKPVTPAVPSQVPEPADAGLTRPLRQPNLDAAQPFHPQDPAPIQSPAFGDPRLTPPLGAGDPALAQPTALGEPQPWIQGDAGLTQPLRRGDAAAVQPSAIADPRRTQPLGAADPAPIQSPAFGDPSSAPPWDGVADPLLTQPLGQGDAGVTRRIEPADARAARAAETSPWTVAAPAPVAESSVTDWWQKPGAATPHDPREDAGAWVTAKSAAAAQESTATWHNDAEIKSAWLEQAEAAASMEGSGTDWWSRREATSSSGTAFGPVAATPGTEQLAAGQRQASDGWASETLATLQTRAADEASAAASRADQGPSAGQAQGGDTASSGPALGEDTTATSGSPGGGAREEAPGKAGAQAKGEFVPANSVEEQLHEAALAGNTDLFLSTLLLATVLIPKSAGTTNGKWRPQPIDGEPHLVCYTSTQILGDPLETVSIKFIKLITEWPDPSWSFAVNPGTPVGATLPGGQLLALANWAKEVGLGGDDEEQATTTAPSEPATAPVAGRANPELTVLQKAVAPSQVAYYLERGYDRVSGFVHRAHEVGHLKSIAQMRQALGLDWEGSPFAADATEIYLLRWSAYRPNLYRIPYGGNHEAGMKAMQGWVIERPPFRGNGFAPGESKEIIAEFKVDSARLPHGARLMRLGEDGQEQMVAVLDADGQRWLRTDGGPS